MTRSNRRLWTAAIFAAMTFSGAAMMARGSIILELQTAAGFESPEWQLGLVAPAGTVGYLVVISVVGFGAGKFNAQRLIALGLAGSGVALLLKGLAPMLAVFLLAVLLRGAMNGVVRGLNRPLLSHFYPSSRGRVYNYYDMAWAIGATAGPLLVIFAVAVADWRLTYYVLAVVTFLLALIVWRLDAPAVETEEESFDRSEALALLRRPEILGMTLAMFFGGGVEGGLFVWLPTYARGELSPTLASAALSVMVAGYVPGRFVYGRLSERVGYLRLLLAVLVALVPAFALTFTVAADAALLAGVAVVGALLAGVYPLLISYATEAVPHHSGPVTAIAAVSSSLGVGFVPALMGGVISGSDAAAAMRLLLVPLVAALVVLIVARVAERRRERVASSTGA